MPIFSNHSHQSVKSYFNSSFLLIWVIGVVCFLLGIFLPIAEIKKFYLFNNEFSLVQSLIKLLTELNAGNVFIFVLLFLFTICFPLFKFVTLLIKILQLKHHKSRVLEKRIEVNREIVSTFSDKLVKYSESLGRLSMIDVFVIALMVLLLKLGFLLTVNIKLGFYFFSISALISLWLTFKLKRE